MKTSIFLCCLVAITIATTETSAELQSKWNEFKLTHGKTYENINEEMKRMEIFAENVKKIEEHNKLYEQGLSTYEMSVNQFADWTHEEFVKYLTKYKPPEYESLLKFQKPLNADLPSSVDWRKKGSVTKVKYQGHCGSSYAFSATGAMEGQLAIRKGKLVSLSEQELLDCDKYNYGCDGGIPHYAFDYAKDNGLSSEKDYPYLGYKDLICRRGIKRDAVRVAERLGIYGDDESALISAVATVGPISVIVDASDWQFYSSGIYNGTCDSQYNSRNHAALVVGYHTNKKGEDYWIVKNSWDKTWGEKGYIRLPLNQNACGINNDALYPVLA